MMKKEGKDVPTNIDRAVKMKPVVKGMCNPALPEDAPSRHWWTMI